MTHDPLTLMASAAQHRWTRRGFGALLVRGMLILASARASFSAPGASAHSQADRVPVLAYYYIWFTGSSWLRAKSDLPALGPYSSDDLAVMVQHIRWAKAAGINGFLVSWKDTPTLSRRLQNLISAANAEQFKLSIIYQGLDFYRKPLPAAQIAADLDTFLNRFASNEAFTMFAKPLVIWSGTWEFTAEDVANVTASRRSQLLILASERNANGYLRLADAVDGDAYYWSSLDPAVDRGYREKLAGMGVAVHEKAGLWIAPAAPGFDARLLGGTRNVERRDGETLRLEMDAASASSPDAIGLISWNEFSENSHVEPSRDQGTRYLDVLAGLLGTAGTDEPGQSAQ